MSPVKVEIQPIQKEKHLKRSEINNRTSDIPKIPNLPDRPKTNSEKSSEVESPQPSSNKFLHPTLEMRNTDVTMTEQLIIPERLLNKNESK